jgi:hypothetical protein
MQLIKLFLGTFGLILLISTMGSMYLDTRKTLKEIYDHTRTNPSIDSNDPIVIHQKHLRSTYPGYKLRYH